MPVQFMFSVKNEHPNTLHRGRFAENRWLLSQESECRKSRCLWKTTKASILRTLNITKHCCDTVWPHLQRGFTPPFPHQTLFTMARPPRQWFTFAYSRAEARRVAFTNSAQRPVTWCRCRKPKYNNP